MSERLLVHIVADYQAGDLAFSELVTALAYHMDGLDWQHQTTPVPNFDTLATGFVVAQLGLAQLRPKNMLIFANCAPRKDLPKARRNNQGEKLVFARLKNGVPLVAVNAGYALSFVKEHLAGQNGERELWTVNVSHDGSQFRSRDIFPEVVGKVARSQFDFTGDRLSVSNVPDFLPGWVAYKDNFGNVKTTYRVGDSGLKGLEPGKHVLVYLNGRMHQAVFSDGSFNVREGELALAPGSSGFDRRFMELFKRGGHASDMFGVPVSGQEVRLFRSRETLTSVSM
jgi:hypothetical protein